ncbi:hypothetical protein [Halomonas denitrificans]|uniref:hypothetical protein n=1 Tax=Halomonas denitrificans TaxID=370769 RepID=UPI001C990B4D|nr:hypothetical protein [Halomonas denitrificans]MBY5969933.1 hypothetical protein [Halomonas denitrificans]
MTYPGHDHVELNDLFASRHYFRRFNQILQYLLRVAGTMHADEQLSRTDVQVLSDYLTRLDYTFDALSTKYLLAGRGPASRLGSLAVDKQDSGFPVATELMRMANDAQQADRHLANMPSVSELKSRMIRTIIADREVPSQLQFAMSQRLYYEELVKGFLFWIQNDPQCEMLAGSESRRRFLIHWAVYDSQVNLPVIYLMEVEDSGRMSLPKDEFRWPGVQAHLMAQSLAGLTLLTIARGLDTDFDDLHPKRLRRFHVGPMYSASYTEQNGPLRDILEQSAPGEDDNWALVWTLEELDSEGTREERTGWFSKVERETFALDPFSDGAAHTGATRTLRSLIVPQRPFQVLQELSPPGFADVQKFVVSPAGQVLRY